MVRKGLYRKKYTEEIDSDNISGKVLLKASFNQNFHLALSLFVFIAVILFVIFAEYTRRQTLVGVVSPLGGMVKVQANDSGYVDKIFVKEGDAVEVMTPLYEIRTERFDRTGSAVKKRIVASIDNQYRLLLERRKQELKKANFERQSLSEQLQRLEREVQILQSVLALSKREFSLARRLVENQQSLVEQHFISEMDYQKQQLDLLIKESQTQTHQLNLHQLLREKESLLSSVKNVDINLNITLKDIDRQLEETNQNKAEFLFQSDSQVVSPITGVIASILADKGHAVNNGQSLLVIVPESDKAFVELYAPSRSIGFIKVGQQVRLRFDAFPYEKFGIQVGIITNVSKSAVAPEMIANNDLVNNSQAEGLYQVKVELLKPTITVYGREERYVPGMTVSADVELDTRKVYEWILEPLYSIKGKV